MLFFSIPTDSRGSLSKEVLSGNAYCIRKFECAISSAFVRLLDVSRSHYWTEKGILSGSLMPSIFGVRKTTAAPPVQTMEIKLWETPLRNTVIQLRNSLFVSEDSLPHQNNCATAPVCGTELRGI